MRHFHTVVLGMGGVGKSALTVRFVKGGFVDNYDPTIDDAYRKVVEIDGRTSILEVTDTAGTEQFTAMNEFYINNASGFVLVFSLTQSSSLREVELLRHQILRIKGKDVPIIVVGTKLDLASEREVQRSHIRELSSEWRIPFYETSAKRNWHVDEAFFDIIRQMMARHPEEEGRKKRKDKCLIM